MILDILKKIKQNYNYIVSFSFFSSFLQDFPMNPLLHCLMSMAFITLIYVTVSSEL